MLQLQFIYLEDKQQQWLLTIQSQIRSVQAQEVVQTNQIGLKDIQNQNQVHHLQHHFLNASSGEKSQFNSKEITFVVTDPPYYDAIAYADISDFFYIWLKKTIGDDYVLNFSTPQTPKSEECTALKHHHDGDEQKAKKHFESKLTQIFECYRNANI